MASGTTAIAVRLRRSTPSEPPRAPWTPRSSEPTSYLPRARSRRRSMPPGLCSLGPGSTSSPGRHASRTTTWPVSAGRRSSQASGGGDILGDAEPGEDREEDIGWGANVGQLRLGERHGDGDSTAPERYGGGFVRCGMDDHEPSLGSLGGCWGVDMNRNGGQLRWADGGRADCEEAGDLPEEPGARIHAGRPEPDVVQVRSARPAVRT